MSRLVFPIRSLTINNPLPYKFEVSIDPPNPGTYFFISMHQKNIQFGHEYTCFLSVKLGKILLRPSREVHDDRTSRKERQEVDHYGFLLGISLSRNKCSIFCSHPRITTVLSPFAVVSELDTRVKGPLMILLIHTFYQKKRNCRSFAHSRNSCKTNQE